MKKKRPGDRDLVWESDRENKRGSGERKHARSTARKAKASVKKVERGGMGGKRKVPLSKKGGLGSELFYVEKRRKMTLFQKRGPRGGGRR